VELRRTHHLVLFCAHDGLELATLLLGMELGIGSEESVTLVPPIPPDDARQATLELLDERAIGVSHVDHETGEDRELDAAEARRRLADPATWDLNASPPVASTFEIFLTPTGEATLRDAHWLFGDAMDRTADEARVRNAEFMRRHPDFVERNARYLKALARWITRGGPEPERPRFD